MTKPAPETMPGRGNGQGLSVRRLLHGSVFGPHGQYLGYVFDVAVRPCHDGQYPLVAGLLAGIGVQEVFLPTSIVRIWRADTITLSTAPRLHPLPDRERVTLVVSELVGHIFTDTTTSARVRASDFLLHRLRLGWALTTIDTGPIPTRHRRGDSTSRLTDWKTMQRTDGS